MKNLKLAATILCAISLIFNTAGEVGEGAKLAATTHSQKQVYKKVKENEHLEYRIVHREPEVTSSKMIKAPKPKPAAVKVINVLATGYTAGVESTGKKPGDKAYGITKSGVQVHRGKYSTVAADTRIFPIGTVLDIPGYGLGVVADTGSAIKGYKIDLFFDTVEDVYNEWGKKHADVKVLKWGNGKLSQDEFNKLNEV